MIYDVVKDCDLHYQLGDAPDSDQPPTCRPRLPLRDLARCCELLAREIRDHRHSLSDNERYATILANVPDYFDASFHLSRAPCPARDLTALKLVYNASFYKHYTCENHLPVWEDLKHLLREPFLIDDLPKTLDVQVFCHVKQDQQNPPDEEKYINEAEGTFCEVGEGSQERAKPRTLRLVEATVEP